MSETETSTVYEQPLNERVRTLLRLEFLFNQHHHHAADRSPAGVRALLRTLLDLLTIVGRSDLKTDLLKELTEQHQALTALQQRPGVNQERLQSVLVEINSAANAMQQLTTHTLGNLLRDNEFLISLLHRSTVPGGASAFDLPGFHHWLSKPHDRIQRDLDAWFADLRPFLEATTLYLRLLRQSTEPSAQLAKGGVHVHNPQGDHAMVRVFVDRGAEVFPEISAGRHRFTIRWMVGRDINVRAVQSTADIAFRLQCCAL